MELAEFSDRLWCLMECILFQSSRLLDALLMQLKISPSCEEHHFHEGLL